MPSATLQARINLFESPDLKDWVVPSKHIPASSISSFHSVSLDHTGSSTSTPSLLDESYEDVSLPAPVIPQPPKLPQRPGTAPPAPTQQSKLPAAPPKRRAPPPVPALSKKPSNASIASYASRASASSLSRTPPIPAPVRKRYEALFDINIVQAKQAAAAYEEKKKNRLSVGLGLGLGAPRKRHAAGWRGLSIDLTTTPPTSPPTSPPRAGSTNSPPRADDLPPSTTTTTASISASSPDEILPNSIVKLIWERSRLPRPVLEGIWLDCARDPKDPKGPKGYKESPGLRKEAFVKGMWRIDEELRRSTLVGSRKGSLNVRRF